jgi:hypothetical protein
MDNLPNAFHMTNLSTFKCLSVHSTWYFKGALDWCMRYIYIYIIIITNNEGVLIIFFGKIVYISNITIFFLFFVSDGL